MGPHPSPRGFSIRIFLADGSSTGLRLVEKSNWIGRGVVVPRSRFAEAKSRPEFGKAGVYVLAGPSPETGQERVYVGEGDPVRPRLEQHAAKKDFWTQAFVFTSEGQNLNKAHVQYLEARLVELAREAKRCELDNGNVPQRPSLSEADQAEVETFLAEMALCLPVLGLSAFERPGPAPRGTTFQLRGRGVEAQGFEADDGFVVLAKSQASKDEVPSIHEYMRALRQDLIARQLLIPEGSRYTFVQDYTFSSPSTAAGVVLGRSANGRVEWKDQNGQTLKELQESINAPTAFERD
jgi:hypothetical protein